MKSFIKRGIITALTLAFVLVGGISVQAQSEDDSITAQLQEQVAELQEQVAKLQERLQEMRDGDDSDDSDTMEPVEMDNSPVMMEGDIDAEELEIGDRGERVRQLQRLLAEDESIYPEGLATGYYGNLTAQAVARLQQRIGIPDDGEFNDETMSRIRDLIANGAGNSGITPPGLITAPGIQRLLGSEDNDDSDDDNDDSVSSEGRRGPDIESMSIPEELKERLRAIFNRFSDEGDDEDELEIEAEVEDGEAEVAIKYPDGDEDDFTFNTMNRKEIIERIVQETNLSKEEVESVIEFDFENDELEIEAEAEDGETEVEIEYMDGTEEEFIFDTTDRNEVIARIVAETNLTREEVEAVLEFGIDEDDDDDDDDDSDDGDSDDDE